MKKKRQGNDIRVKWTLLAGDAPLDLGRYVLTLYLKTPFGKQIVKDFDVIGNVIAWTFFGKDQKQSGIYSLELVGNEGKEDMFTIDACKFIQLVPCSCQESGLDNENVETETIELTSSIEVTPPSIEIEVDAALSETSTNPVQNRAVTAELKKKQETISDLSAIRSGAAKGATAIQEVKTINGESIVGSGNLVIQGGGSSYDDTALWNELEKKADKSELTKLSEEVSGLSERIDNLPTAESSVFEAVYGVTAYEEIVEAYNAKKHVLCIWNDRVYNLSNIDESRNTINFSSVVGGVVYLAYIFNGVWGNRQENFENVRNMTQTISEASATHQYPSAKAVYDFVNNTLGVIINGDY